MYFEGTSLPKSLQPNKIHFLDNHGKKPYVYVGNLGLLGGMGKGTDLNEQPNVGIKENDIRRVKIVDGIAKQPNVVIHEIDPKEYITGKFKHKEEQNDNNDNSELYTPPHRPNAAPKQMVQMYQGELPIHSLSEATIDALVMQAKKGDSQALLKLLDTSHVNHAYVQMYEEGTGVTKNLKQAARKSRLLQALSSQFKLSEQEVVNSLTVPSRNG